MIGFIATYINQITKRIPPKVKISLHVSPSGQYFSLIFFSVWIVGATADLIVSVVIFSSPESKSILALTFTVSYDHC